MEKGSGGAVEGGTRVHLNAVHFRAVSLLAVTAPTDSLGVTTARKIFAEQLCRCLLVLFT